jgi:hypothetical protein
MKANKERKKEITRKKERNNKKERKNKECKMQYAYQFVNICS